MPRMSNFIERHAGKIAGVVSCFDRVVIMGTLPDICYAGAMESYLRKRGTRLFDYARFAEPLRDELREHAERLAREAGLTIDFIRRTDFRKEERVKEIVRQRGEHPGLVHIFSAMEPCASFRPWHDKTTHRTSLKPTAAKCLHYYFYFIDPALGLCYLRVPTWAPFRLQFYFNGHNQLARALERKHLGFQMLDNAFVAVDDFEKAQALADAVDARALHRQLDRIARTYCPVLRHFRSAYHWSLMQVEYSTDVIFHRQADFQPLYEAITYTAIHAVKPENVATFLGRKLVGHYQGELGNDFHTRIEGTRIKHHMGPASIKLYDKHGLIARVECTANDVSFFKHYRKVEHRDGTQEHKLAPLRKSIYSLHDLRQLLADANRRYLDFIAAIDDPTPGLRDLEKISRPAHDGQRSHKGFNLFHGDDLDLFQVILRGEFNISGFQASSVRRYLPNVPAARVSRMIKRLRVHGLTKKIGNRYKYYLTALGRRVVTTALKLRELVVIPALNIPSPTPGS
jgi:hypothetical protein